MKRGAGLGPAIAFLLSAPALDIVPLMLTFRLMGSGFAWARLVSIAVFGVLMGMAMEAAFRRETQPAGSFLGALEETDVSKRWWMHLVFFGLLVVIMVAATDQHWLVAGLFTVALAVFFVIFYSRDDFTAWISATYQFARFLLPWFLLGMVGSALVALFVPTGLVLDYTGSNTLSSCFISTMLGSVLYLCPPSEVLFTRACLDLGMAPGPALSFILTSPAVSLPSIIVLVRIIGWKKAIVYMVLLTVLATLFGYGYGLLRG